MYYCYDYDKQKGYHDGEREFAKELGVYLFYDKDSDSFLDKDRNIVDLKDKDCFIRTGIYEFPELMTAVKRHGGKNITKDGEWNKVLNWPNYIKTKRNATIYKGEEIINNLNLIVDIYGDKKLFFKTKDKNYSGIIDVNDLCNKDSNLYRALEIHKDEDFIVSDEVNILENDNGPFEWRCFIVNNKILNISRTNNKLLEQIPDNIIDRATDIINQLKESDFPNSYVLDLFMYNDLNNNQVLDVLECNPIEASGTYLYNSVFIYDYDIKHICPSASIPKEKLMFEDINNLSYDALYEGRASIIYQLPGHFAGTLASIALTGRADNFSYLHIDSETAPDFTKINLDNAKTLQSDSDLEYLKPKEQFKIDELLSSLKEGEDAIKKLMKKLDNN